jgi:transcriptional regulator with XRE-family HTH domain
MGHKSRQKPAKLGNKLARIRTELGLSQNEMIRRLGFADELRQSHISMFEHGEREPTLIVLLRYARVARVSTDILIDDDLDLPKRLASRPKH